MPRYKTEARVSFFFYNYLIRFYLPFEAKYVALRGKKDKTLVQKLVRFYFCHIRPNYSNRINEKDFINDYLPQLNDIFNPAMCEYTGLLKELIVRNDIRLSEDEYSYYKNSVLEKKYDRAINLLEKKLKIYESRNRILGKPNIHIDSDIYRRELETINRYLDYFGRAYSKLEEKINQHKDSPTYEKVEYLFFAVSHEFMNFLSHYSTAIVFFDSPTVFINNLQKAIGHLKRALMDIYDGLIAEDGLNKDLDYLSLRAIKMNALGNSEKIQDLVNGLKEFYENHTKATV
ncbi:hypothetical protein [Nitratifractor sp.]|uniref:hypothetical protein n=1 Tax=Nitratifractor sp. TaxID=2268144 RepID=UPI0025DB0CA5|nr:hypothetical protein [Nitratifractor sp.]